MAQEADRRKGLQILQFLYKLITKHSIFEPLALHGSGGRSAKGRSDASIPLQIGIKTKHFGGSGASWLKMAIRQILFKCFKSFTNSLQNGALWSLGRLMAQEADC